MVRTATQAAEFALKAAQSEWQLRWQDFNIPNVTPDAAMIEVIERVSLRVKVGIGAGDVITMEVFQDSGGALNLTGVALTVTRLFPTG